MAAALGLSSAGIAAAADTGFYLGGAIGSSQLKSKDSEIDIGGIPYRKNGSDMGYKAFVGYNFTQNIGAEVEYLDLGQQRVKFTPIDRTNDMTLKGFNLSAVGRLPVGNAFELFGKLGLSYIANRSHEYGTSFLAMEGTPSADNSDHKTKVSYGLGVIYNVTKEVGIRGEWQHFDAPAGMHTVSMKSDFFSVGASYSF